jgi:hypothetical protein
MEFGTRIACGISAIMKLRRAAALSAGGRGAPHDHERKVSYTHTFLS